MGPGAVTTAETELAMALYRKSVLKQAKFRRILELRAGPSLACRLALHGMQLVVSREAADERADVHVQRELAPRGDEGIELLDGHDVLDGKHARRFIARPSGLSLPVLVLSAIGSLSPLPTVSSRFASIPRLVRYAFTALARRSDKRWL